MNIEIQARPFSLTPSLVDAVHRQLERISDRHGTRISSISVHLDDVNGDRGGIDKRCRIVVRLAPRLTLVGQALSADLYHAIGVAARRAQTALGKRGGRSRFTRDAVPTRLAQTPDAVA